MKLNYILGLLTLVTATSFGTEIKEPHPPADISKYVRVAVLQWSPPPAPVGITAQVAEAHKAGNRDALARFAQEAASTGAKMVIFPEFSVVGYPDIPELPPEEDEFRNREEVKPYVESIQGPTVKYFANLARKLKIYIQVGFAEVDSTTQAYYNATAVLGPNGSLVASYRKMNLYSGERNFLSPGRSVVTYQSPMGLTGIAVCSDVYSSNVISSLKTAKVAAVTVGMSWATQSGPTSSVAGAARSLKAYVLFSNNDYFPATGVVNPDGKFQSLIVQENGLAYGYVPRVNTKR